MLFVAFPTKRTPAGWVRALSLIALVGACHGSAWAKQMGIGVPGCNGCHEGGQMATVAVTANATAPATGQTIRLSVSVSSADIKVGGLYLTALSVTDPPVPVGQLKILDAAVMRPVEQGVTHVKPKTAVGGKVTFDVDWVAPNTMSSAVISVSSIAGNNNQTDLGDAFGRDRLAFAIGCNNGSEYWTDFDGDGFGDDTALPIRACAAMSGFAPKKGDCNDNNKMTLPMAKELCNDLDDNCDGKTDEGFTQVALFRDFDNDGYGAGTETKMGCGAFPGWGVGNKDCNDNDKAIHPDAEEMCNNKDDDCDARIDEGVLPTCGMGACERAAPSCDSASSCRPGTPQAEKCNYRDDDCDGKIDNGADICGADKSCVEGVCVAGGSSGGSSGGGSSGDGGGGDGGGDGGDGGSGDEPGNSSSSGGCQIGNGAAPPSAVLLTLGLGAFVVARRRSRWRR